jgi:hypothetical protein
MRSLHRGGRAYGFDCARLDQEGRILMDDGRTTRREPLDDAIRQNKSRVHAAFSA